MLTTCASCWGSFILRGAALALFGVALLAGAANAASIGLRMRASSAGWWLPVTEAAVLALLAAAILAGRAADGLPLATAAAGLAALDGLYLAALAWRHRHGAYPIWPVAAAGLVSIGFAALLTRYAVLAAGQAEPATAAFAMALGAASMWAGAQLRGIGRLARHELLRDAPLGCAWTAGRTGGQPAVARLRPSEGRVPA